MQILLMRLGKVLLSLRQFFTKITAKQDSYINTSFTKEHPNQKKNSENTCKYYAFK